MEQTLTSTQELQLLALAAIFIPLLIIIPIWSIIDMRKRPLNEKWTEKRRGEWTTVWVVSWFFGAVWLTGICYLIAVRRKLGPRVAEA